MRPKNGPLRAPRTASPLFFREFPVSRPFSGAERVQKPSLSSTLTAQRPRAAASARRPRRDEGFRRIDKPANPLTGVGPSGRMTRPQIPRPGTSRNGVRGGAPNPRAGLPLRPARFLPIIPLVFHRVAHKPAVFTPPRVLHDRSAVPERRPPPPPMETPFARPERAPPASVLPRGSGAHGPPGGPRPSPLPPPAAAPEARGPLPPEARKSPRHI